MFSLFPLSFEPGLASERRDPGSNEAELSCAIATLRKTIGATNPADAEPGSIRGDLASSMPDNLVHGSDSPESAEREVALWFSDDELV